MLLVIIALITLTVVNGSIKKSEEILYNTQINNIKDGAKNWSADNIKSLPDDGEVYLTLAQLKQGGYVEENIKSPANNKMCFPNDLEVKITITESGNYKYNIATDKNSINYITCDNDDLDINSPGIVLTKNADSKINKSNEVIDYVEVNKTNNNGNGYQVLAHNFYNRDGKKIDKSEYEDYNISITVNGNEVQDLENINVNIGNYGVTYKIVYTITENEKTVSAIRNVIVQDTIKPTITLTGVAEEETGEIVTRTRYIYMSDGKYKPISNWCNMSVSDNSNDTELNGNLTVTKSDNCSKAITKPGTYNVIVTANDKSGNTQKKSYNYIFKENKLSGPLITYNEDNNLPNDIWTKNNVLSINYSYGDICTSGIKNDETYITIGGNKYYGSSGKDSNGVYNIKYTLSDGVYNVGSINIHAVCSDGRITDETIDDQIYKIDTTDPSYTSVAVKNITTTGYDVYIYGLSDNNGSGIDKVEFKNTSTSKSNTSIGTDLGNGTWHYHVNIKNHDYDYNEYETTIKIYDQAGNAITLDPVNAVVPGVVITYNNNYSGIHTTVTQGAGSTIKLPTNPTREGYIFNGWYDAAIGGHKIEDTTIVPTANTTYYAQWTAASYTVTYNYNGATGGNTTANKKVTYNGTYGTLPTPTKTGYTFDGWYKESSLTNKVETTTKVTAASDHILYAKWTAASYTVTYNYNGATGGNTTANKKVTYNGTYGTLPTPTKTGYTFLGWYKESNFTNKVETTTKVTATSNHTIYAKWIDVVSAPTIICGVPRAQAGTIYASNNADSKPNCGDGDELNHYQVVWITNESTTSGTIDHYEYCVSSTNSSANCTWTKLYNNQVGVESQPDLDVAYYHVKNTDLSQAFLGDVDKLVQHRYNTKASEDRPISDSNWLRTAQNITNKGTNYVFFRGVSKLGGVSAPSNSIMVKIDNKPPTISSKSVNYTEKEYTLYFNMVVRNSSSVSCNNGSVGCDSYGRLKSINMTSTGTITLKRAWGQSNRTYDYTSNLINNTTNSTGFWVSGQSDVGVNFTTKGTVSNITLVPIYKGKSSNVDLGFAYASVAGVDLQLRGYDSACNTSNWTASGAGYVYGCINRKNNVTTVSMPSFGGYTKQFTVRFADSGGVLDGQSEKTCSIESGTCSWNICDKVNNCQTFTCNYDSEQCS